LTTVALDAPDMATQLIADQRWPIEIKLHGDFRSRRLKNTSDELRFQEKRLRQILVDCCRRFGLVVVGYSGRDTSIMETLEEVLEQNGAFPSGLFWLHRGEDPPLARVQQLLVRAEKAGVEAALVQVENFDEVMRDLVRLTKGIDTKILDKFTSDRRRWSAAPYPEGSRGWPVIRLNALPLVQTPTVCRRVECKIGGHAEVRSAVEKAGVDVLVARTQAGVLAYGADEDVRNVFGPHGIRSFDLHTIEIKRLRYESGERGLLRDALTRAIQRKYGLEVIRRRSTDLLAPRDLQNPEWEPLRLLVGALSGTVKGHSELRWREGIGTRLDWAGDQLWLLFEPRIVFNGITQENKAVAADFARERTVRRYNRQVNDLIAFWSVRLAGDGCELRALGIGEGVDAIFRLSSDTGFSMRAGV
jgi:hypothetical protein